jgi:hypothetical protein
MSSINQGKEFKFDSDLPYVKFDKDRLGTIQLANRLSKTLIEQPMKAGLVFGIEGPWGSGKTSLLDAVVQQINPDKPNNQNIIGTGTPAIIRFQPWLIGNRQLLLRSLFAEMAQKIDETFSTKNTVDKIFLKKARKLSKYLKKYAVIAAPLAPVAGVVGLKFGIPNASEIYKSICDIILSVPEKSLNELKINISDQLMKFDRKLIVIIDDIDRLEPDEVIEVLRLVKSVGNFPNVTYIMSYDRKIICNSINIALQVSGEDFLGKIVQISFKIPNPNDFDLREWLREEIFKIVNLSRPNYLDNVSNISISDRFKYLLNIEGQIRLKTARDVIRCINHFKMYWVHVGHIVDPGDMIWLSMIYIQNRDLHEWIERYLSALNEQDMGATVPKDRKTDLFFELRKILENDGRNFDVYMKFLKQIFPSIKQIQIGSSSNSQEYDLFDDLTALNLADLEREKRLYHFKYTRYYFSFSHNSDASSIEEEIDFSEAKNSIDFLQNFFIQKSKIDRPQGGNMCEYIISDIYKRVDQFNIDQLGLICSSFTDIMDDVVSNQTLGMWGQYQIWDFGKYILTNYLNRLDPERQNEFIRISFENGRAISWLSSVHRTQFHFRSKMETIEPERLLSTRAYNAATEILLTRWRSLPESVLKGPKFLDILWAWKQAGNSDHGPRHWCQTISETDDGLIDLLEACKSWGATNDVVYFSIRERDISPFVDFDECMHRVNEIVENNEKLSERAKLLISMFVKQGDDIF